MSGGFRYSHRDIRKRDIRHIYSGYSRSALCLPPPVNKEGLRHLERIHDQMKHPEVPKLPGKYFEYSKQYKIIIPTAPAFRRFSKTEVADLVSRLISKREADAQNQTPTDKDDVRVVSSAPASRCRRLCREQPPSDKSRKETASEAEVDNISRRLYSARTHSATLRQREKVVMTSHDSSATRPKKESKRKKNM